VAAVAAVAAVVVLFGAHPLDPGGADPVRQALLTGLAAEQAQAADTALAEAERLMRDGVREGGRGQAAILSGPDDPADALNLAAAAFEAAAEPLDAAQDPLAALRWTLLALDPLAEPPTLLLRPTDAQDIGAQWRAAALPASALADLRREAEATLESLEDALAALETDDYDAALAAVEDAEASLAQVRAFNGDLSTLPFWIDTVDALLEATGDIARAAQAGDEAAVAEAQAAYDAAAEHADQADQALTIALGEAAARVTGPASTSSAVALRAVQATRESLAAVSILP
jgi:hypothetical protein